MLHSHCRLGVCRSLNGHSVLPLQLEVASYSGFVVVLAIIAILIHAAYSAGFPAVRSGELKVWSMNVSRRQWLTKSKCCLMPRAPISIQLKSIAPVDSCLQWTPDLPEAFAVLGFAFYLHPMVRSSSRGCACTRLRRPDGLDSVLHDNRASGVVYAP